MMIIQQTFMNQEERLLYYQLFCHYYRGDFNQLTLEDWLKVRTTFKRISKYLFYR